MVSSVPIETSAQLSAIPGVVVELLQRLSDPDFTVRDAGDLIASDPAIVSHVLQMVNSALFSLPMDVADPRQAVALLGKPTITGIALSFSLSPSSNAVGEHHASYRDYWNSSVLVAISARRLGREFDSKREAEYFTCGLLANIGRLCLLENAISEYSEVISEARESERALRVVEQEQFGFTHTEVSARMLENWSLPAHVVNVARLHHNAIGALTEHFDAQNLGLAQAIAFSAQLFESFADRNTAAFEEALDAAERLYGWSSDNAAAHTDAVLEQVVEVSDLFDVDPNTLPDPTQLMAVAVQGLTQDVASQNVRVREIATKAETLQRETRELNSQVEQLTLKTTTDELTGAFTRDYLTGKLKSLIEHQIEGFCLLFLDIDNFKGINDTYGHVAGDIALKGVAEAISGSIRDSDTLARFGGDEFVILLEAANDSIVEVVGERLRKSVAESSFDYDGSQLGVTVSVGGVIVEPNEQQCIESIDDQVKLLLDSADQALYASKRGGKNQLSIHHHRTPGKESSLA